MSTSLKFGLIAFSGVFVATFIWMWLHYGVDVVLAYAHGIALMCF